MKTFNAKKEDVSRKWYVVDLDDKVLGRAAVEIANVLRGKNKPEFTPHVDTGDFIVVVNANKVKLTGQKWQDKKYYFHSKYVGHMKTFSAKELLDRKPELFIKKAVKGMLPKSKLGRQMLSKLKVYPTDAHPHTAQKPEVYNLNA